MITTQEMEQTTPGADHDVNQPRQLSSLRSHLWKETLEKFLKGEPKILGVVQVLIALLNLSLGTVIMSVTLSYQNLEYFFLLVCIGYTILASVMFIISGSLSIAAGTKRTKGLGMNAMVLILTLLEFCIALSLSVFGCKVTCCKSRGVVFILPSNVHMAETAPPAPFKEV
uniref:Membrane-spanning 4-domains subfamily A member 4A n=1 Tax=Catagonus wagneri TaxID=51154 RepID=A0A8C3YWI3_9CETA